MKQSDEILIVSNLSEYAPLALEGQRLTLLDNISFSLNRNEILGLVGETGSGKSILLDAVGRNPKPPLMVEAERIDIRFNDRLVNLLQMEEGELRRIWGKKIAFIPPNARDRLNPILTVGEQAANVVQANFKLSREGACRKVVEMFEMVQMPDPKRNFDSYPHELSGGMAQRVIISIALSVSPKLLLADEPTMGLDVTIQTQVLDLMASLLKKLDSSVILATRDLGIVANYCDKVAVLCYGQLVEFAEVRDFFKNAKHPYSDYLLAAAFAAHQREVDLESADTRDEIIEIRNEASCRFARRCPYVKDICRSVKPAEISISPTHFVRCHGLEDK